MFSMFTSNLSPFLLLHPLQVWWTSVPFPPAPATQVVVDSWLEQGSSNPGSFLTSCETLDKFYDLLWLRCLICKVRAFKYFTSQEICMIQKSASWTPLHPGGQQQWQCWHEDHKRLEALPHFTYHIILLDSDRSPFGGGQPSIITLMEFP